MNYTLAVFQTRFSTLSFANLLKRNNIPLAVINTPYGLQQTCGISIKILSEYFAIVQNILRSSSAAEYFYGFFEYVYDGRRWNLKRK